MPLPKPIPGLVLRYSYLWYRDHRQGREEGEKDRPCAIVATLRRDESGDTHVLVLPITHSPPDHPDAAIEIPFRVKQRLGLEEARSWIVLSEWNEFVWPGPDLRRLPGADDRSIAYGVLPPALFNTVRERFLASARQRRSQPVPRT